MKEALQSTLILVLWVAFWLAGTIGGAVLQAWLIDIGVVSDIDPPWIITIGSSFIGFFAGAYAAIKLGNCHCEKIIALGRKTEKLKTSTSCVLCPEIGLERCSLRPPDDIRGHLSATRSPRRRGRAHSAE
jgi:hypothetical protein